MKNTHLEHPEDSALESKESVDQVINYLRACGSTDYLLSVKYDGAPAIVFGTNPENGRFFVGTKSVFNKVKILINYTHADIEKNHAKNDKLRGVLHTCLEVLPRVEGVYQGDFIGFGGKTVFRSNTLTYDFAPDSGVLDRAIVFCCHTSYKGTTMKDMTASFYAPYYLQQSTDKVKFINPDARITSRRRRIDYILGLASLVSNFVKYPDAKEVAQLKIAVNKCVRENRNVSEVISGKMLLLFNLLTQAKLLLMEGFTVVGDTPDVYIDLGIDRINSGHEGYVHQNDHGAFKFVNRRVFSHYNFTLPKVW